MESTVNQRYKITRSHLGLSQKELAERLSVTQASISSIERGGSGVSVNLIKKTSDVFGININWLLRGEGEMFSHTGKKHISSSEWRDEAYSELKNKNALLEKEVERLWKLVQHLTGG